MSNALARQVERVEITDAQRIKILAACAKDRSLGHVRAARAAGVEGTRGQIGNALAKDEEFQAGLAEANIAYLTKIGLGIEKLLGKLAYVADDDGNTSQLRAIVHGLSLHGIHFSDRQQVDVNHSGEVENPDVAAAVERLNALVSAAALRGAAGGRKTPAALEP